MRKAFNSSNVFMTVMVILFICILCGSGCYFRSKNVQYVKEGSVEFKNIEDQSHTIIDPALSDDENSAKKKAKEAASHPKGSSNKVIDKDKAVKAKK